MFSNKQPDNVNITFGKNSPIITGDVALSFNNGGAMTLTAKEPHRVTVSNVAAGSDVVVAVGNISARKVVVGGDVTVSNAKVVAGSDVSVNNVTAAFFSAEAPLVVDKEVESKKDRSCCFCL